MKKPKSQSELDFLALPNRKAEKVKLLMKEKDIDAGGHIITSIENYKDIGVKLMVDGKSIIIVNPPVKVPDGTTYEEIVDGETVTMSNHEFNPRKALEEAVKQYFNSKK